jgi:hypothetical protein
MATVDPLRYRTNGDDPEIDPRLLEQVMDTLTTAQRTRDGYTTPADSVYSVVGRSPSMGIARRMAQAMMRRELALHEAEDNLVQEDLRHSGLAQLTGDVRQAEDNPSLFEFVQYYSPDMRRQLMAKMFGTEGRASGGILNLLQR